MEMATYSKKPFSKSKNFTSDEYIRCIDNTGNKRYVVLQNFTAVGIPIEYYETLPLTIGKSYKVLYQSYEVSIINDLGVKESYSPHLFSKISVEDWRNLQLEKILNK